MWLGVLAACTSPRPGARSPDPTASSPTTPITTSAPEAPPAPNISDVLGDCGGEFHQPPAYPNQLEHGDDLHRLTLVDPDALCNDGTPGVIYVRSASDAAHADDWLFHFQGGKDCVSYADCAARWCGDGIYDASKMSSAWAPISMRGPGIFAQIPENSFRGWNHVYLYYCSSDDWIGRSLGTPTPPEGEPAFSLERRGRTIVEAAVAVALAGATSDDGAQVLPPLDAAHLVLWTGTSAGSIGTQTSLDWMDGVLPGRVLGVFDAGIGSDPAFLPPDVAELSEQRSADRWAERTAAEAEPPAGDDSCLETAEQPWYCSTSSHLPYGWITTPFFAREDVVDPVTEGIYQPFGLTMRDFQVAITASLGELNALSATADGVPLERQASVFGPGCGDHLGLEAGAPLFRVVVDGSPAPLDLHDALAAWLAGTDVSAVDDDLAHSLCE